jgi:GPH family glycoside/pentoside/hexuronide:cation symporter
MPLPWYYSIIQAPVFGNAINGGRWVGAFIGVLIVVFGVLGALAIKERPMPVVATPARRGPAPSPAKKCARIIRQVSRNRPFLLVLGSVAAPLIAIDLIILVLPYIYIYDLAAGNKARGGYLIGAVGTLAYLIGSLAVTPPLWWLARRFGKKRILLGFFLIGLAGALLQWICFTPHCPWLALLPASLISLAFNGMAPLSSSMTADVCDLAELRSGIRDSGMFSAFTTWTQKAAVGLALGVSGIVLTMTGYSASTTAPPTGSALLAMKIAVVALPSIAWCFSFVCISCYSISDQQMGEVRRALDERRQISAASPDQKPPGAV